MIFTVKELELLLCSTSEVTYKDMILHTQVEGETANCPTLDWFWSIVESFGVDNRAKLLRFVTGSSILPMGGFETLNPPFSISITPPQPGRLPSAHTWYVCASALQGLATSHATPTNLLLLWLCYSLPAASTASTFHSVTQKRSFVLPS
jgi:hypothetical protein